MKRDSYLNQLTAALRRRAGTIAAGSVTNANLADMAAHLIKARKTNSTGSPEDATLSEVLDFIGSAAQGDILYRGASGWARLAAGTSGYFLKTEGASANPAWAQVTGASGGGLVLIEKKLFTSDSTSHTFSGLDGNTDEVYRLVGRIKLAATARIDWQPNGTTTNQHSFRWNTAGNTNYTTGMVLWDAVNGDYAMIDITIQAKANPNSQSFKRVYGGLIFALNTSNVSGGGPIGGGWNETSTNITSIVVNATVASAIANGSTLALYKHAQT